jgi:hypothetical protein
MIHIIGGLSGCGKSTIGRFLRRKENMFWFELDTFPRDAVNDFRIRTEWENLLQGKTEAMENRFPEPMVLTIPSMPIFKAPNFKNNPKVRVSYLIGSEDACIRALGERDGMTTDAARTHWAQNNADLRVYLEGDCPGDWKINVFNGDGTRRTISDIVADVLKGTR